ncbi:MAG: dTDP-4-dehydrorhamnose 3,5-epimerase [Ardenticatenaceae bacterium]|nr:dTDP-4-dehydrorhamnose 3,5-epimerase [Ardenticatenaceae bacterium]MCB8950114.1 dTDP-4-dehydrorhamnose 3,5-epimerase [Ardenticatenaceae bacterium]
MIFTETKLQGAYIVEPDPIHDNRGFFARVICRNEFDHVDLTTDFVQANITFSPQKGTLRGMHYQIAPHKEVKLVRCTQGGIYDVIIDLRPQSPTYMEWLATEITAENRKMVYIPGGFAHGYQTIADKTEVFYLVAQFYAPEYERGMRWNDPAFQIEWPDGPELVLSDKDRAWPDFVPEPNPNGRIPNVRTS